ncbi:MAG: hypothetical protein AAFU49_11480 [Pseudomonadota bacterium]
MTPRAKDFGLPEPTPEDHAFWAPHLRDGEILLWAGRPQRSMETPVSALTARVRVRRVALYAGACGLFWMTLRAGAFFLQGDPVPISVVLEGPALAGLLLLLGVLAEAIRSLQGGFPSLRISREVYGITSEHLCVLRPNRFSEGCQISRHKLRPEMQSSIISHDHNRDLSSVGVSHGKAPTTWWGDYDAGRFILVFEGVRGGAGVAGFIVQLSEAA